METQLLERQPVGWGTEAVIHFTACDDLVQLLDVNAQPKEPPGSHWNPGMACDLFQIITVASKF